MGYVKIKIKSVASRDDLKLWEDRMLEKAKCWNKFCFIFISNYASFKAENDDYHSLKNEFIGTFISFKMNRNTHNLQWEI